MVVFAALNYPIFLHGEETEDLQEISILFPGPILLTIVSS